MPDGTRQRLIARALALLADEGVEAVTLRRVARDVGVSHGAPLRHFPNRAALLSAMAATGFSMLSERMAAGGLRATCQSYMDFARAEPALYALMFQLDPMNTTVFGQFRARVPAEVAAAPLWASLYGLVHMRLADSLDDMLDVHLH
ncbi:TetR/AcrR family transcriptional regulator [Actinocrispum wychmicini]|uniref:TetR family transcriptional regulator n=1 Tax=Actinocrispum wychmicini TaxID=1213861 RepID=A0A4V2S538_9PSEU|nr:TetR/AcrR family transcriptional regulator [Actinocrispum wychmicini]TCO50630.1 TetR family transcriptional regulator [Actinocrispum wychmicini]